jgi:hypothetical protein
VKSNIGSQIPAIPGHTETGFGDKNRKNKNMGKDQKWSA